MSTSAMVMDDVRGDGLRRRFAPSDSMRSAIESVAVYEPEREALHIGIPRAEIHLVVRVGPAAKGAIDAHAFGSRGHVHRKLPRGIDRSVTVRLRLGGAMHVLGAPASELAGRIVPLDDLWGAAATRRLLACLVEARDARDAAQTMEAAIAERGPAARAPSLPLLAAARLERANVHEVARDLGVSERHLRRIFHETIGLRPKAFAKLARFRRALRMARDEGVSSWAAIAVTSGYYDQAHLIAEFREIAGTTPRALLAELRTARSLA